MKQKLHLISFLFIFLSGSLIYAQAPDSTLFIKDGSDTITDFTNWANKGSVGIIPLHMQPGFNGLLNYGVGADIVFALPSWVTFRAKAVINLYEGDRSLWRDKVYDNAEEVSKGHWFEGGIDINFLDKTNKTATTQIDSTGRFVYCEGTMREYSKGAYADRSRKYTQYMYGKYYSFDTYLYRGALRLGAMQYQYTYLDKTPVVPTLTNLSITAIYGGLSFSRIGLGKAAYFNVYADVMYKASLKSSPETGYESFSKKGQIGYRLGVNGGSDWLGFLAELGMAPGLDKLVPYLKAGLIIQYQLLPPRQNKYKKPLPDADLSE
jgi:hypothetical protein